MWHAAQVIEEAAVLMPDQRRVGLLECPQHLRRRLIQLMVGSTEDLLDGLGLTGRASLPLRELLAAALRWRRDGAMPLRSAILEKVTCLSVW